ncbi:S8 family peptidase [Candidatus Parcubacteria bacterium]|nr:S8 family peptidase [Candidatus Parcubacteria bacterium]
MKKHFILLTLIAVLLASTAIGVVVASPNDLATKKPIKVKQLNADIPQKINKAPKENGRIIVSTPNFLNKVSYWVKGCKQKQKMNDSVAYECSPKVAKKLIANGNAREDRIFQITDLKADKQINADDVWAMNPPVGGITGAGVKVAILDTGVDSIHAELSDSIILTENFTGEPDNNDNHGHGTHVSGIITADGIYRIRNNYATGVAPGAEIIVGKVCNKNGSCVESDIIAGIEWATGEKANVLNLSLGYENYDGHCDTDPLAAKVNWAVEQGLVVTVSSGNDNKGVSSPACASKAIAVGSVNKLGARASFSNYGSTLDLVAPGVDILSTYSCVAAGNCGYYWYANMSGTSMSAPHVAGTVALILQKNPDYTVDNVKEALYNTAVDLGTDGWDQYYGHGIIDAYAAVNYAGGCLNSADCDDDNECTTDTCNTTTGECSNDPVSDNTMCGIDMDRICCGGACSVPVLECDDDNECTEDVCTAAGTCSASCSNNWPTCGFVDGCCGPLCSYANDADCPIIEDPCLSCFKGVCDGKCNPSKEDSSCPDCQVK